MRRTLLVLASAMLAAPALLAQSDSATVVATVTHFFDGMRTRDTALMRSTVVPDAVLRSVSGPTNLSDPTPVDQFISRVGSGTGPGANEQIKDPKVSIDGPLASLWAYYTLTRGGQLNHCGVDLFLLRHGTDGWRIFYVSDTRRTEGCTPI